MPAGPCRQHQRPTCGVGKNHTKLSSRLTRIPAGVTPYEPHRQQLSEGCTLTFKSREARYRA